VVFDHIEQQIQRQQKNRDDHQQGAQAKGSKKWAIFSSAFVTVHGRVLHLNFRSTRTGQRIYGRGRRFSQRTGVSY
jgi:hypothetical protein